MRIRFKTGALLSLCFLAIAVPSSAQILGTTARQMPKGSLTLLTYYQGTQGQNLNFNVAAPALFAGDVPSRTVPSRNCTDPVGAVLFPVTVAVSSTAS